MLTREDLLAKLKAYAKYDDEELAHVEADKALLEFINDVDIQKAFDAIDKWYA